jgi:hypothetical protein
MMSINTLSEPSFTWFEEGNQIVIRMLEERGHEKIDCA